MIYKSTIPIHPHATRMNLVKQDGRPYYRQHFPGYCDFEPESFFFDSFDDVIDYVLQSFEGAEILLSHSTAHLPEVLVMVIFPTKVYHVVGYMQNLPKVDGIREWSGDIDYRGPSKVGVGFITNLRSELTTFSHKSTNKIDTYVINTVLDIMGKQEQRPCDDFNDRLSWLWGGLNDGWGESNHYPSKDLIRIIEGYLEANGYPYPWGIKE